MHKLSLELWDMVFKSQVCRKEDFDKRLTDWLKEKVTAYSKHFDNGVVLKEYFGIKEESLEEIVDVIFKREDGMYDSAKSWRKGVTAEIIGASKRYFKDHPEELK